ncbi:MAG: InlB B-repeat-containing protein [Lachnospiraceae bacterium]|nr:InlB B-repeat-containing protein [Lachnospiraceae bacterium]
MKRALSLILSIALILSVTAQDVLAMEPATQPVTEQDESVLAGYTDAADADEDPEIEIAEEPVEEADDPETETEEEEGPDGEEIVLGYRYIPGEEDVESVTVLPDDADERLRGFDWDTALPASYTTDTAYLPNLRDQNPYGSCWAHSAMATAEISMLKQGLVTSADYSELHLAYFSYNTPADPTGRMAGDDNQGIYDEYSENFTQLGGNHEFSSKILASWVGAANESVAPYSTASSAIATGLSDSIAYQDAAHLKNYYKVNTSSSTEDRNAIKRMVRDLGAAAVSYFALTSGQKYTFDDGTSVSYSQAFNSTNKCYYYPIDNSTKKIGGIGVAETNHAVTIVGWDDSFSRDNFTVKPEGNGAWLIRNSWTTSGSPSNMSYYGYFWMSYYDKSLARSAAWGYEYDTAPANVNVHNYQYDGAMDSTARGFSNEVYAANVFHVASDATTETLEAVSFATETTNLDYKAEIYLNPDAGDPASGILVSEAQGSTYYAGYYTAELDTPVVLNPGDTFSVVLHLVKSGSVVTILTEYSQAGNYSGAWYKTTAAISAGQSYIKRIAGTRTYSDGTVETVWSDWQDQVSYNTNYGNLRIKAFTRNGGSDQPTTYYNVIYHANNGTDATGTQQIQRGQSTALNANPFSYTGYTFTGWNTKAGGGGTGYTDQESVFNLAAANGTVHLYAQWKANKYTVYYDPQGGSLSQSSKTVTYDSTYGTLPTPSRTGYTFGNWYTAATGGDPVSSGTKVTIASDHTLYARWTANSYTVTFDANGGSVSPSTKSVTYGSAYGDLPKPTRQGYDFDGWYTVKDAGTKVTKDTQVQTAKAHTLYAKWKGAKHTVTFETHGGTITSGSATKQVYTESTYGELPVVTRELYTFDGWYTSEYGGTQITETTRVTAVSNETLHAHWTGVKSTVTFDANGGSITSGSATKLVTYQGTYGTLPTVSRSGYAFRGWYTAKSGGEKITAGLTVTITSAQTLYAQWSTNTYTVTFDANGGTCQIASKQVSYNGTYGELPAVVPRTGFLFDGWYTTRKSGGVRVDAGTTVSTAGNHTLYARFQPAPHTVTFNPGEGTITSGSASKTVYYQGQYGDLPEVWREGAKFLGWFTDPTGGEKIEPAVIVTGTGNETLYAHWKIVMGFRVEGLEESYVYTGSAIKPVLQVYDNDYDEAVALKEKTDYTVAYANCTNAGTAKVTVTGKGNYCQFFDETYEIKARDISESGPYADEFRADDIYVQYNEKKPYVPNPVLYRNNKKLVKGKDYELYWKVGPYASCSPISTAGTFKIQIKGCNNYEGIREIDLVIAEPEKIMLSGAKITATNVNYTPGTVTEPEITVKLKNNDLVPNRDYEILWPGQKKKEDVRNEAVMENAGTVTFTVRGINEYAGTAKGTYKIIGTQIKANWVTFDNTDPMFLYSGQEVKPAGDIADNNSGIVSVYDPVAKRGLVKGTDYTVSYTGDLINAGSASMTITGTGGYTGSVTKKFKINPIVDNKTPWNYDRSKFKVILPYVKGGTVQAKDAFDTVTINGVVAKNGRDFTVTYKNNQKPGYSFDANPPKVILTGIGNFKGSKMELAYTITAQNITGTGENGKPAVEVSVPDMVYTGKAGGYAVTPVLTDTRSGLMLDKKDYQSKLSYKYMENTYVQQLVKRELVDVYRAAGDEIQKADIIEPGTKLYVEIVGINGYFGKVQAGYTVQRGDLSKLKVKVADKDYTGHAVTLTKGEITFTTPAGMVEPTQADFEIIGYSNNIKKGTATVILKGTGNYGGMKSVTFKIKQRSMLQKLFQ